MTLNKIQLPTFISVKRRMVAIGAGPCRANNKLILVTGDLSPGHIYN